MKSMTGFGASKEICKELNAEINIEISSVNKKNIDIRTGLTNDIQFLEHNIKETIKQSFARGSFFVKITLDLDDSAVVAKINENLLKNLVTKAQNINKELNFTEDLHLKDFLAIPGIVEQKKTEIKPENLKKHIIPVLMKAIKELKKMRSLEGENLLKDSKLRISQLEDLLTQIEPFAKEVPLIQKEKLLKKLNSLDLDIDLNEDRVLREIVVFSDKADISEEITRLKSHFKQFYLYCEESIPVGRSLDFLIQEMFREINTLGNKASHADISKYVVAFKTELEKIREQIQNVE